MESNSRITHAYMVGIGLRNDLDDGITLSEAIRRVDGTFETLQDDYPDWHPAPYSFEGISSSSTIGRSRATATVSWQNTQSWRIRSD